MEDHCKYNFGNNRVIPAKTYEEQKMKGFIKKFTVLSMCAVLGIAAVGCASISVSTASDKKEASISASSEKKEEPNGAPDDDFTGYIALLTEHFYLLSGPVEDLPEYSGHEGFYWIADFRYDVDYTGEPATKLIGFKCHDYSGDGRPELIIAEYPINEEWANHTDIKTVYTMTGEDDYKIVVEGWGRNRQYLLDTGEFYNEGSAGATEGCFGTYRLSYDGTKQEWIDFYFSTEVNGKVGFYHNTSGVWDIKVSEILDIDEAKFFDLQRSYQEKIIDIDLKPIQSMQSICGIMGGSLINVMYKEDCPFDTAELREFDISGDNSPVSVVIETYDDVYDLTLCNIEWGEEKGGEQDFTFVPIERIGDVAWGNAVMVHASFPGDMSALYLTCKDSLENLHAYCITISGKDGSLVLEPWY